LAGLANQELLVLSKKLNNNQDFPLMKSCQVKFSLPWLWCYLTPSERWGVEELHGDPTVGPRPKSEPEVKNGRNSSEDGAPERLKCRTI